MPAPVDDKNETTRFLGEGVSFKAKLIGILEVSEARGDRMCQEALSDLKTAIRAAGEHKQRITINIAIDGLRLRDEKTGDSLYHHPVHKISFIAQDMTDSRAFGYIFGSPDTGHRFFGIKTDKAASQVVIAMRDLFQVVFALKKKEIELAKQHLDKSRYGTSPLFSESSVSSKISTVETSSKSANSQSKATSTAERSTPAVADLVDLELELSSLQQGLNQMERITPSDTYTSKDDPFGDSFIPFPPMLPPPPPTGKERASRTSESSSLFSPKTPHTTASIDTLGDAKDLNLPHDFSLNDEPSSGDWFTPPAGNSLFEEPALPVSEVPKPPDQHEKKKQEILSQFDVFTDLDPLGTGKSKPYVDKKHFFQELKNPPKKVLKDLVQEGQPKDPSAVFPANFDLVTVPTPTTNSSNLSTSPNLFTSDPFGDDPFTKADPFSEGDPFDTDLFRDTKDFNEHFNFPSAKKVEKQMSVASAPVRHVNFNKQNTFDTQFNKLTHLHENPSLDLSSESECAPEPPPRPATNVNQIKPPPLPPKKMQEVCTKPPPRPPHTDDLHYDYMENFETAPNSLEYFKSNIDESPPLPVPQRKSKFENDFTTPPERPKKNFNLTTEEDDYLTPISGPYPDKKPSVLLPPPQKSRKGAASPNVTSSVDSKLPSDKNSLEGLDITLSQLTLTGLNDLAAKLEIPQAQLSNMTLVQLTQYLSNFIKNKAETKNEPTFQADFANFNDFNRKSSETYDRYAVFRELLQEEIKQTKIDTEPQEITENITVIHEEKITNKNDVVDRYAALREIVEIEIKNSPKEVSIEENENEEVNGTTDENNLNEDDGKTEVETENEVNKLNNELFTESKENVTKVIEYHSPLEIKKDVIATTPTKSPIKSPLDKLRKSPIPEVITEIMKNDARLTSGSLSDVISGSSPEIDNTASNSEKKKSADATGESWAIFDQPNSTQDLIKDKQNIQSEEGVSPWSSDSKEFGNSSPPEYRPRIDSESGGEHYNRRRRDKEQGWWDTSAEPEVQYHPANRRSTDSYEDDCYDCYDRPRRRRQGGWPAHGAQATGGHSSSSRDVSPWEEEPSRRRDMREYREPRQMWTSKHGRQHSFDRHRDRRHNDSWDEEDDYEYEEEHRFHWQDRHGGREPERERHGRDVEPERWVEDRNEDGRKHRRRRESERGRWCCPDWEQGEAEKPRYGSGRYSEVPSAKWRERKHDERYYSRESQESPWEDEYSNDPDETHAPHYLTAPRRNWKQRPSSASEMDRKTGGSDGERDRRYKPNRRSKSRESPFSDISHNRHKPDPGLTIRSRKHHHQKPHFESDFNQDVKKLETTSVKKTSTLGRKKKDSPKTEEVNTFPRQSTARAQSLFENDFVPTETDSPESATLSRRFTFENDFETSGADSPIIKVRHEEKTVKLGLQRGRYQAKQRSLFEDDFSPTEKAEAQQESTGISSIKEEGLHDAEEQDSFGRGSLRGNGIRKKILSKGRLSANLHDGLKKSESVNIFVRENDPFDDDFFSGQDGSDLTPGESGRERVSPRTSELKWTEQFEHFERK